MSALADQGLPATRPAPEAKTAEPKGRLLSTRLEHVAQAIARNTDRWASLLGEDMPFVVAQREHVAELQAVARLMVKP